MRQIENLRRTIREIRQEWLENAAWAKTLQTPRHTPMWEKAWMGKKILATEAQAARLQALMDEESS